MKNFIDTNSASGKPDEIMFRTTPSYVELEMIKDEFSIYVYLIPRTETSFFVTTCWGDNFDGLLTELDEDSFEILADTWPTITKMLINGANEKFQEGVLIRLEDADYGEIKWFATTVAGNVKISENFDDFFEQERIQEAIQLVIQRSVEISNEFQNEPNTGKYIWKGIKKGVGWGLAAGFLGALGIPPIDFE